MKISGLSYRIGRTVILDDLSAECPEAAITAIVGPNGAGKTTLLRCLCGDLVPDRVSVTFRERRAELSAPEWKRVVGVVPDSDALFGELTVEEQLGLAATLFGIHGENQRERVETLADLFGLSGRLDTLGRELSAGLRKRLAIALSLIHAPELLLLDEPLNSLDYAGGETLFELLRFLRSVGRTVFISGHSLAALIRIADRVVEIDEGRVVNSVEVPDDGRSIERLLPLLRTPFGGATREGAPSVSLPWMVR